MTQRGGIRVASILVLSSDEGSSVLPALSLLSHRVRTIPAEPAALVNAPTADIVVVDARHDLAGAKALCRILTTTGLSAALLVAVSEAGMPALNSEWGFDDVVLASAGPGEVDARIRLLTTRAAKSSDDQMISTSGVTIDEVSYQAKVNGRALDLTFKEFELLRFLAGHPQRVFSREQLLSEVWGYDYFGGTRTVDVHVRRLRAKLGDMESLIGTVRNVGYRFTVAEASQEVREKEESEARKSSEP
jgi:DNA-binding response OmpR family regulator